MHRTLFLTLFALVAAGSLIGCGRKAPPVVVPIPNSVNPNAVNPNGELVASPKSADGPAAAVDPARQEKYEAAMRTAGNLVADQKFADALGVLETAQLVNNTDEVRREIDRVKGLMTRNGEADKAAQEIAGVLRDGNPNDAARLATAALKPFGDGFQAQRLVLLKLQADALVVVDLDDKNADKAARLARFVKEGQAEADDNNYRAALLSFEQAVRAGAGADIQQKLDDMKAKLNRYDELREKAADLRRDPGSLEDALAMLTDAQKAWDTLQIRQDIDDCRLAILRRRDRLGVADFETLGNPGDAIDGPTVAQELLPAFKARFDVVERGQINKLLDELKLQGDDIAGDDAQRELGRLAGIRYLVLGSVNTRGGVRINARLVEVRTGLVVQTGKIFAKTPDEAMKLLPHLADMLTMSDEDRIALEDKLAKNAMDNAVVEAAPAQAVAVPAAPPAPAADQPANQPAPQAMAMFNPQPPAFGNIGVDDFNRFAPTPPAGQPLTSPIIVLDTDPLRNRFIFVNVQVGDYCFSLGRFRDALRHYEVALSLAPGNPDIAFRVQRTLPFVNLPAFAAQQVLVPVVRPRVAVFSFFVGGNPLFVPAGFGNWSADILAGQLYGYYNLVDRGELFWYMARLGLTMQDVVYNPGVRFWLARTMGVRYFVLGYVQPTASFNVTTLLIDAETGFQTGIGAIHVRDIFEYKLRAGELAYQMRLAPAAQTAFVQGALTRERLLIDIRRLLRENRPGEALALGRPALVANPWDIALRSLLETAERQAAELATLEGRRRAWQEQQAARTAIQQQNALLVQQAEQARIKAEQEARLRDEAARRAEERRRERAQEHLVAEARSSMTARNFAIGAGLLAAAVALKPSDDGARQLAEARALEAARLKAREAEDKNKRDDAKRKEQQAEIAQLKGKLDEDRKKTQADELARKKAQEAHDQAAFATLLQSGKDQLKQQKFDAAIASFSAARGLQTNDESQKLLDEARDRKAKAELEKKSADERAAIEKKLAEQKAIHAQTEAQAKKNQDAYNTALSAAQKALAEKRYDAAVAKYTEAGRLFQTDAVTSGLNRATQGLQAQQAAAAVEARHKQEAQEQAAQFRKLIDDGKAKLTAKEFDAALKSANEAIKLKPGDSEATALLTNIEKARSSGESAKLDAKKKADEFKKLVDDGKQQMANKKYDDAIKSFQKAHDLMPDDKSASDLLASAQKAKTDDASTTGTGTSNPTNTATQVQALLKQGQTALAAGDLAGAAKAFEAASKLSPQQADVLRFQQDLKKAQTEAAALEAKKKEEAAKRTEFARLMNQGAVAKTNKRYNEAVTAFRDALKLMPDDPKATAALVDAQKALDLSKTPAKPTPQEEYNKQMQAASAAETKRQWNEAMQAYQQALKSMPGDAKATAGQKNASYQKNMDDGRQALNAKQYQNAAKFFDAALRDKPGDPTASDLLKKAKAGK